MARLGNIILTLALIGALCAAAGAIWFSQAIDAPGPLAAEKLIYIEPGKSVKAITAKLHEEGAIDNDLAFLIHARLKNRMGDLKAGEYQFTPHMTISAIVDLLQSGKTYQHQITVPEGLMVIEILDLLKNEPVLTGEVSTLPPEGSLLPETYNFSYNDTRASVIVRMQTSMSEELQALWEKRAPDIPVKTPEEAVVLASIVEKETGIAAERPRVAGVFVNRLNQGMPLQSDPTVIYAVTQGKVKLERALTYNDLKLASPYNTYVVAGLPPGPIANPGKASLSAVLNPEKHEYIYFVADGTGGHAFAKTLKEHNNNVVRWRMINKP